MPVWPKYSLYVKVLLVEPPRHQNSPVNCWSRTGLNDTFIRYAPRRIKTSRCNSSLRNSSIDCVAVHMVEEDYYKSERFIHDELLKVAARGVAGIYEVWKDDGKINSFVIGWPAEKLLDDDGVPLEDACVKELPDDRTSWSRELTEFASRTKAYALMLAERKDGKILVIFESHHGTRSWTIPIYRSGDRDVLGREAVVDDTHSIGLLWKQNRGTS